MTLNNSQSLLSNPQNVLRNVTANAFNLASEEATTEWKNDLLALFYNAKNRFPDIVWRALDGEVWGHKAIVYVRLDSKGVPYPPRTTSLGNGGAHRTGLHERHPHKSIPKPPVAGPVSEGLGKITILESALTQEELATVIRTSYAADSAPPSSGMYPIPLFRMPPLDVTTRQHGQKPTKGIQLFKIGPSTEFFQRKFIAVWKEKRHTDIQIIVPSFGQEGEVSLSSFSAHRSILVSRSPVLRNKLLNNTTKDAPITLKLDMNVVTMTLPCPPFTSSTLTVILEYMYSGSITFQNNFTLDTLLSIIQGAIFLDMPTLQKLVVAHIVVNVLHGLFHAYITNAEYADLVCSSWSKMRGLYGCHCTNCKTRIPRVLEFALESNVHSYVLRRGARRALIGMFGLGWCSQQFASIPPKIRVSILIDVKAMVTPINVFALLIASHTALERLDESEEPWDITVRAMILSVRNKVDEVLCTESEECFDSEDWENIASMDSLTGQSRLELIMTAILRATRGEQSSYVTSVYQTFDSMELPMTPRNFFVRAIVEHVKHELLSNMAPMLSSSTITSASLSKPFPLATKQEEIDRNTSQGPVSYSHSPKRQTISANSLIQTESLRPGRSSDTTSIYSDISDQTVPWSVLDGPTTQWERDDLRTRSGLATNWNNSQSDISRILTLDLADSSSTYSRASSHTLSTDYGVFYTRHAISNQSFSTLSRRFLTSSRRNSWDSLMNLY